ncbi:MAG: hypothetical protein WCK53_10970 [Methanomicrobiales archaeon]
MAVCIAGCTNQSAPATPGKITTTPTVAITSTPQTADCSNIGTSGPGSVSWISQPPANPTNAALLSSAKALMKGIYTYSPGSPDYLPNSYKDQKSSCTIYTVHAANPSNISWAPDGETQVVWKSIPGDTPKGWSGIVVAAGPTNTKGNPEPVHVMTDCSGFITGLFTFTNTIQPTKFTSWTTGSPVPEASCKDPLGSCTVPNSLNYYHLFVSGQNGWFQNVSLSDLQPGDLISFSNTYQSDPGHIMLVAAVSSCTGYPNSRYVVVIDETGSPHSFDTRPVKTLPSGEKTGEGLGMGIIRLSYSPENILQFYWGLETTKPQPGYVALGRAL